MPNESNSNFDQSIPSLDGETKTLSEVLKMAMDYRLSNLHTWLPCSITKIHNPSLVDIQPLIQFSYANGTKYLLPEVQNVMVVVPRGTNYFIQVPIAVGDTGVALFCERSLDVWGVSGGQVDPNDTRTHDISDPVFIPGLFPKSQPSTGDPDSLTLHNGEGEAVITKDGKFKFQGESQELLSVLDGLVDTLINALVITGIGPQPFFAETVTELQEVKTKLETLKV